MLAPRRARLTSHWQKPQSEWGSAVIALPLAPFPSPREARCWESWALGASLIFCPVWRVFSQLNHLTSRSVCLLSSYSPRCFTSVLCFAQCQHYLISPGEAVRLLFAFTITSPIPFLPGFSVSGVLLFLGFSGLAGKKAVLGSMASPYLGPLYSPWFF